MAYTKKDLELAFKSTDKNFKKFLSAIDKMKAEEKAKKKAEEKAKAEEAASRFDYEEDYDSTTFEFNSETEFKKKLEKFLKKLNYEHTEWCENMPDGGVDYERVIKVNDQFYLVDINSGSEWHSEYSMRCNTAGDPTINKLWLITGYEEISCGIKIITKMQVK